MQASLKQLLAGMVMLPLSVVPFGLYFTRTQEGGLLWGRVRTSVAPPRAPRLSAADHAWAKANGPDYAGAVAVLVYHGLGGSDEAEGRFTISPERFGEQLAMLRAADMHPVTAREVALAHAGLLSLPPNAVMISFDDGRADAMMYADPILSSLGLRATMFVIASAASEPGIYYVGWKKLKEYSRSGRWDIESHTANAHREQEAAGGRSLPVLTSMRPGESKGAYQGRIRDDLRRASRTIEREIGIPPLTLAYPFGAYGADDRRNADVLAAVGDATRASYALAFHQDEQETWAPSGCSDQPLLLRRLEVGDWTGRDLVSRITSASAGLRHECLWGERGMDAMPRYVQAQLREVARRLRAAPASAAEADATAAMDTGDAAGPCPLTGTSCGKVYEPPQAAVPAGVLVAPVFVPGPGVIPLRTGGRVSRYSPVSETGQSATTDQVPSSPPPATAPPATPPPATAPPPSPGVTPSPPGQSPQPTTAPTPPPANDGGRGRGNGGAPPGQAKKGK